MRSSDKRFSGFISPKIEECAMLLEIGVCSSLNESIDLTSPATRDITALSLGVLALLRDSSGVEYLLQLTDTPESSELLNAPGIIVPSSSNQFLCTFLNTLS